MICFTEKVSAFSTISALHISKFFCRKRQYLMIPCSLHSLFPNRRMKNGGIRSSKKTSEHNNLYHTAHVMQPTGNDSKPLDRCNWLYKGAEPGLTQCFMLLHPCYTIRSPSLMYADKLYLDPLKQQERCLHTIS